MNHTELRCPQPEAMLRKSTGDASCTVGTSSMTSCSTQSPGRSELREPRQQHRRRKSSAIGGGDVSDEDSLHDLLDNMIAESSAKWKSSVQTMQTSTMLQASWTSMTTTETPTPSISRVASVEDLVRKQQQEIQTLRDALATTAPITHVSIPTTSAMMDHDELTVDL